MELSPDQEVVYRGMERWVERGKAPILSVGGYAGTGKTTLLSKFIADQVGNRNIVCAAYTGKAANVLAQKLAVLVGDMVEVTTIHRLVYNPFENQEGEVRFKRREKIGGKHKESTGLIVLDEASMVSDRLLGDIQEYGIPVLAIGDHGQLPPVGEAGSFMQAPDLRLEKIHRQAESSPIVKVAHAVREHGEFPNPLPAGVTLKPNNAYRDTLRAHVKDSTPEALYDTAILSYTNRTRTFANASVRAFRYGSEAAAGPREGDVVICLRNDHVVGVFNGMRGVITEYRKLDKGPFDWMRVRFPDDPGKSYSGPIVRAQFGREGTIATPADFQSIPGLEKCKSVNEVGAGFFDYGYAMTVHKSQGSQFKTVFLILDLKPSGEREPGLWRKWCYTGITRTVETLTFVRA